MRKIYFALLLLLCSPMLSSASPGDTTWVQANNVQLNYFNNFDTTVAFPDGTKSYRKIYMIFTLGKYACPGTPQYCGDWDYTVQNYFMAKNRPDTFELGRLITPYAHTGSYRFAANWTQRYIYDVTDYYPALKDTGTIRIHYSGYSGGFTGNIKFAFIEGTPERNVLRVDRLWKGDFNYGHGSTPINTALGTLNKSAPAGSLNTKVRLNLTGHGGDDQACAEFCPNVYTLSMNGNTVAQKQFFREDCSMNDLYAQTGTWIYARANWCPGAIVHTITHDLPVPSTGGAYTVGLTFPNYTSTTVNGGSHASYTIEGAVVYYGAMPKTLDASLEDIIAPTKAEYHWRENPSSSHPILSIRNSGTTTITSIKINYGVDNHSQQTYTWSGSLAALETRKITLPTFSHLRAAAGDHMFWARIAEANGAADVDSFNNTMYTTFTAAPVWPADLQISMRTNVEAHPSTSGISQTAWRIEDAAGNIVKQKADCPVNTTCDSTFHLEEGAYRFFVSDSNYEGYYDISTAAVVGVFTGTGLSGFSSNSGFIRVFDANAGGQVQLPGYMSGNFGGGFSQQFYVGAPVSVKPVNAEAATMKAFPNPSSNTLTVVVDGLAKSYGTLRITDMLGREVLSQEYTKGFREVKVSALQAGFYILSYSNGEGVRLQERIMIAR
jgi:hypothetical protein